MLKNVFEQINYFFHAIDNYKKLERKFCDISMQKDELEEMVQRLESQIRGQRLCSNHCQICEHGFKIDYPATYPAIWNSHFNGYACALDCTCKDFKDKRKLRI